MKLYNTRTRSVERLQPLTDGQIRMYTCGPTVYDYAHIGNLASYVFADTLRRVLEVNGLQVTHAMNYTDVDDKTIRRSHERYPADEPGSALRKLTDEYIGLFQKDMLLIGNTLAAFTFLRATDPNVIDGMQKLITDLYSAGFAYIADDGIYFSIDAYRKSGKKYGQLLKLTLENTSESRIENDEYDKESAHDFALWKKQKDNEPSWPFTINGHDLTGRPGWHVECSVMSYQLLGQPFDIHTGGIDLIFPHHENEIAQSTAGKENPLMASFFVHNEHILVDGKKMAKSSGNFYTLQDILDHGFDPLGFRMLVLQSHYRSQTHFTLENLKSASNRLKRYRNFAELRHQLPVKGGGTIDPQLLAIQNNELLPALSNDLDTPQALHAIEQFMDRVEKDGLSASQEVFNAFLTVFDHIFGLELMAIPDVADAVKQLIAKRERARNAKNWQDADSIRVQLQEQGIGIRDTASGPIWYRI